MTDQLLQGTNNTSSRSYNQFIQQVYKHASHDHKSPYQNEFTLPMIPHSYQQTTEHSEWKQYRYGVLRLVLNCMINDQILIRRLGIDGTFYRFHPTFPDPEKLCGETSWPYDFMNETKESYQEQQALFSLENHVHLDMALAATQPDDITNDEDLPRPRSPPTTGKKRPRSNSGASDTSSGSDPSSPIFIEPLKLNLQPHAPVQQTPSPQRSISTHTSAPRHNETPIKTTLNDSCGLSTSPVVEQANEIPVVDLLPLGWMLCPRKPHCMRHRELSLYREEYPNDRFAGLHKFDQSTGSEIQVIMCLECPGKKVLEPPKFRKYLEAAEHTCNVLLRLQKGGQEPEETPFTKTRLEALERLADQRGFSSVQKYLVVRSNSANQLETQSLKDIVKTSNSSFKRPHLDLVAEETGPGTKINLEAIKMPETQLPSQIAPRASPIPQKLTTELSARISAIEYHGRVQDLRRDEYMKQFSHNVSEHKDFKEQIALIKSRLLIAKRDLSNASVSLQELTKNVNQVVHTTQALSRTPSKYEDDIELLKKNSVQVKAMAEMMERAIETIANENTETRNLTSKLDRQEEENQSNLVLIAKLTEEVKSIKQKLSSKTNHKLANALVKNLESQLREQEQATKSFMQKTEGRFEALIKQHADNIVSMQNADDIQKTPLSSLKKELSLQIARMDIEETASPSRKKARRSTKQTKKTKKND